MILILAAIWTVGACYSQEMADKFKDVANVVFKDMSLTVEEVPTLNNIKVTKLQIYEVYLKASEKNSSLQDGYLHAVLGGAYGSISVEAEMKISGTFNVGE